MKKLAIALVVLLMLLGAAAALFMPRGPSIEDFADIREPKIKPKADTKVIVVTATGAPGSVGKEAFGLLFKAYFQLEGTPKGPQQPAPRARWPVPADTPQDQWVGRYAMPVPESETQLPDVEDGEGMQLELDTWTYGEVAEILHVGPYSKETPTIERLKKFIEDSGYEIAGEHEEEYAKGPGMFFEGDPEEYLTVIRYPVKERAKPTPPSTPQPTPGSGEAPE